MLLPCRQLFSAWKGPGQENQALRGRPGSPLLCEGSSCRVHTVPLFLPWLLEPGFYHMSPERKELRALLYRSGVTFLPCIPRHQESGGWRGGGREVRAGLSAGELPIFTQGCFASCPWEFPGQSNPVSTSNSAINWLDDSSQSLASVILEERLSQMVASAHQNLPGSFSGTQVLVPTLGL